VVNSRTAGAVGLWKLRERLGDLGSLEQVEDYSLDEHHRLEKRGSLDDVTSRWNDATRRVWGRLTEGGEEGGDVLVCHR